MKLDRIDIRIMHELQKNGRITNVELAELVHLSPSPCLMRVKKLQDAGYIIGYSAQISLAKLGTTITVFTEVTLKNHRQIDFARFQQAIEKVDEVIECHLIHHRLDRRLSGDHGATDRQRHRHRQVFQLRGDEDAVHEIPPPTQETVSALSICLNSRAPDQSAPEWARPLATPGAPRPHGVLHPPPAFGMQYAE